MSVEVRDSGPLRWVTLNRPEKANALDRATIARLLEVIDQAEHDPNVRALALTGVGRAFSAGGDLAEVLANGADGLRGFLEQFRSLNTRLERSPLVVAAAVNGAARAGGLELALACDLIIAGRSATFGDAHLANDILPGGGSTVRLPRAIGWQRARWLILTGASICSDKAREWGLVMEVVEDSNLRIAVERALEPLVSISKQTLERAKRLLAQTGDQSFDASLTAEITMLEAHYHSDAFRTGIARFLKRR